MRIYKDTAGNFQIDDAPLRITGEAATKFLADMAARDAAPPDPKRVAFLAECVAVYRRYRPEARP